MELFERLTRLTISVTPGAAARLGELAQRAGRGITIARVAPAALDVGLGRVSEAMDQERPAASGPPPGDTVREGRKLPSNKSHHKKIGEVIAGFLDDVLKNWRPDRPMKRWRRYVVAWLGAMSFLLPMLLANVMSLGELHRDVVNVNATMGFSVGASIMAVLPAILIGTNTPRQSSIQIFFAGFLLPYILWLLTGLLLNLGGSS